MKNIGRFFTIALMFGYAMTSKGQIMMYYDSIIAKEVPAPLCISGLMLNKPRPDLLDSSSSTQLYIESYIGQTMVIYDECSPTSVSYFTNEEWRNMGVIKKKNDEKLCKAIDTLFIGWPEPYVVDSILIMGNHNYVFYLREKRSGIICTLKNHNNKANRTFLLLSQYEYLRNRLIGKNICVHTSLIPINAYTFERTSSNDTTICKSVSDIFFADGGYYLDLGNTGDLLWTSYLEPAFLKNKKIPVEYVRIAN